MICCNGMRFAKGWLTSVALYVGLASAADVAPLYFESLGASPSENSVAQQEYWDDLMKYKLWATGKNPADTSLGLTYGIEFVGQNIKIPDASGYTGSARAGLSMANTNHVIGGPILLGGGISTADGNDTLLTGPVRLLGNFNAGSNSNGKNLFAGTHCVQGSLTAAAINGITGSLYQGAAYGNCPSDVPALETNLDIPSLEYSGAYTDGPGSGVIASNNGSETINIDIPAGASSSDVYDLYIRSISLSNGADLQVRMPPTGRLTRIFMSGAITLGGGSTIQVAYVDAGATFVGGSWTNVSSTTVVANENYLGNLLFYTPQSINWPAFWGSEIIQGTYISKGNIILQQHFRFAGQFIANFISINADFDATSFLYVPFDPPVLDPTALASGLLYEGVVAPQTVNVRLDKAPETEVSFKYCFQFKTTPVDSVAEAADITDIPLCSEGAYKTVSIPAGSLTPTTASLVKVTVADDAITENKEYFQIKIYDLAGAILPDQTRSGFFNLAIIDDDNGPVDPTSANVVISWYEDSSYTFKVTDFTLSPASQTLQSIRVLGTVANGTFSLNGATVVAGQLIDVADISSLLFRGDTNEFNATAYAAFDFRVFNSVGDSSVTYTVTIKLAAVNDLPILANATLTVAENSAAGTSVGTIIATDVDSDTITYSITGGTGSTLFAINSSTGQVTVAPLAVLNYETASSYTLIVTANDGHGGVVTKTYTVTLTNLNEVPTVVSMNDTTIYWRNTYIDTVKASDVDNPSTLSYSLDASAPLGLTINASSGVLNWTPERSDISATAYPVTITITDGALSTTVSFDITVARTNANPVISTIKFAIDENSASGTILGTVAATDSDNDTLSYSITGGTGSTLFTIDASTGVVTLAAGAALNYETQASYTLFVLVSDGFGGNVTKTITIDVGDVNEAPAITSTTFTVSESVSSGSAIGTVKYTDPDSDAVAYAILTDGSGKFEITSTGSLKLLTGETLDYEEATSYTVTVVITDPEGLADTADIVVNISNVKESSEVKITRAETIDSVWVNPDSLYVNVTTLDVEWTEDGVRHYETVTLHEGENIIIKTYLDPTKDTPGADTLIVFVNTDGPKVAVSVTTSTQNPVTGVTIVETKDAGDTATYIKSETTKLAITVVDSSKVGNEKEVFNVTLELDTLAVSTSTIKTMETIQSTAILEEESRLGDDQKVTHTAINGDVIAVSYTYTDTRGNDVTVTYYTDTAGNRILENGTAYFEVSYTYKDSEGKWVTLTYTTDAKGNAVTNAAGNVLYDVSYTYTDANDNMVTITYTTDSKGNEVRDADGNMIYEVAYTYKDGYGNTATQSVGIVLDVVAPVVRILSPENQSTTSNVAIEVVWTVDGVEQDTLNMQGLKDGVNEIIRTYRDKAGNEGSDTVLVLLKNGKEVQVTVEEPLVTMDPERLEEYYASNPSASEETYGVSFLNVKTGLEEEVAVGTSSGTETGSLEEPYPGFSGSHLGPTLVVDAQIPAVNTLGNSATLADLVESDGLISLDSGGGWDREKVTVAEYVENYCSEDFAKSVDLTNLSEANLYTNQFQMQIWVFSSLGQFVDDFSFSQTLDSEDYVDDGGMVKMYFEIKPDSKGYLRDENSRRYGTGAYIFKVTVKMVSVLQCQLPDAKLGSKRIISDDILKSWGYSRPE